MGGVKGHGWTLSLSCLWGGGMRVGVGVGVGEWEEWGRMEWWNFGGSEGLEGELLLREFGV